MASLVQNLINVLKNTFSKEMIVFITSLLPILELRGGLLASAILKIPYLKAAIICIIGNILPIPFILLFLNKIFGIMEKWEPTKGIVKFFKDKAIKNKSKIDKYEFWGLVLFVGIPLPGTGAWTGSLIASVLELDRKKTFGCVLVGVLVASIIMMIISFGLIANVIR